MNSLAMVLPNPSEHLKEQLQLPENIDFPWHFQMSNPKNKNKNFKTPQCLSGADLVCIPILITKHSMY